MRRNWFLPFALLLLSPPLFSSDPVEDLIENEKKTYEEWVEGAGEETLPWEILRPYQGGVELFSPSVHGLEGNALCSPMPLDELIELAGLSERDESVEINLRLKRARDFLDQYCLVRPGDYVVSVGKADSHFVQLSGLAVASQPPVCPDDPPHALVGTLKKPEDEAPFFYVSSSEWTPGPTHWRAAETLNKRTLSDLEKKRLSKPVPFLKEYVIEAWSLSDQRYPIMIKVDRKQTRLDDVYLLRQALIWMDEDHDRILLEERVSAEEPVRTLVFDGLWDFNQDGFTDLALTAIRGGTLEKAFFEGGVDGLRAMAFPQFDRGCP